MCCGTFQEGKVCVCGVWDIQEGMSRRYGVCCGTFQEGKVCVCGVWDIQEGMLCVVGHFKKVRCVCGVWDIQEGKVCVWCVLIKEHFKKVCTVCGVREWVAGHFKKVCVVCVYSTCVLLSTIPNMRRGNM